MLKKRSRSNKLLHMKLHGVHTVLDVDNSAIYMCFDVKDVRESLSTVSMTEFIKRIQKFVSIMCSEECSILMTTHVSRNDENYLKKVEHVLQNRIVELEYDRANTRIIRELKKLKEIHRRILSGHIPLDIATRICLSCKVPSVEEEFLSRFIKVLVERAKLAARFIGVELEVSATSAGDVYTIRNFRIGEEGNEA